jgi:outer membrane protein OmpA-like peptidoglycan-associated protein/tetratricopeptide (TPR) repeat protein
MIKKYTLCVLIYTLYINANAQFYIEEKAIYNEAEEYLTGEEYEEALPLYHLLEKRDVINSNISYKIGLCYLNIDGKKSRSIPYLEDAVQNVSENYTGSFEEYNAPPESWLLLGKAYHIDADFTKAKACFSKLDSCSSDSNLIQLAHFYLSRTNTAELFQKYPSDAKIEVLPNNSNFSLYNQSRISDSEFVMMEKRKFYDAVVATRLDNNLLTIFQNLTPVIRADGNLFLSGGSENGKMLIFKGYNAGQGFDLYFVSQDEDGEWDKYQRFPEPVNSVYNESSAYLTSDNILFFTSNRAGGVGGDDIYMTKLDSRQKWSTPKNLGKNINTPFNELAPVLSSNGNTLFYCSQGHLNMGGYDLFYSKQTGDNNWGAAINMGSPFSSPSDDKFFSVSTDLKNFYTTRFDNIEGVSTLYRIRLNGPMPGKKVIVSGEVSFSDSVPPKTVKVAFVNGDLENSVETNQAEGFSTLLSPGKYTVKYEYNDSIYASQDLTIYQEHSLDEVFLLPPVWKSEKKSAGISFPSGAEENISTTVVYLKDILFAFNSSKIQPRYYPMLDSLARILKEEQASSLLAVGFTDAIGKSDYNLNLSKQRAKTVANYILRHGVSSQQVNFTGKGENNPVASNLLNNGMDNPDGRKFNRRVEIQLKTNDENLQILYIDRVPEQFKVQ